MTIYDDDPVMAVEAELIHAFTQRGITLCSCRFHELELLLLAVYGVETREEHDNREIEKKQSIGKRLASIGYGSTQGAQAERARR